MDGDSVGYWVSEASRLTADAREIKEEQEERIAKFKGCGPLVKYVECHTVICYRSKFIRSNQVVRRENHTSPFGLFPQPNPGALKF